MRVIIKGGIFYWDGGRESSVLYQACCRFHPLSISAELPLSAHLFNLPLGELETPAVTSDQAVVQHRLV